MKTILYQPLFINPQAYFVFPQLYHIEKGDSYIEPANITGQLIINDLTKVLTSTPTLNVVQDTNSSLTDYSGNNRNATCKNFDWNNTEFVDDGKAIRLNGNGNCIVGIDMPQLDKYTVIVKRRWIDKKSENKWFCSLGSGDYTSVSQSLFWFEDGLLNNVFYTYNRGYKNPR